MNQYFNLKVARESARIVDIAFLLIHIVLFFYFKVFGVTPMAHLNVLSIALYTVCFFWLNTAKLNVLIYIAGVEIFIHNVCATICIGRLCGMQWILLFMPIEYFYMEYFSLQIRGKKAHATIISLIHLLAFVLLEIYMIDHDPLYSIPANVADVTRLVLICMILSIAIFLLRTLTKYAYLTEKKIREKTAVDSLTGLYNRFELMDELDARVQRDELRGAWAAMVDIDNFTQINEKFGRNIGDHVLMRVADVLRAQNRNVLCARWGGDKFLICGFDSKEEQEIIETMNQLRQRLNQITFDMVEGEIHINATIGLSFYQDGDSVRQWLGMVDKKLYAGKYNGKNCVVN